jgi:hypothetical protein
MSRARRAAQELGKTAEWLDLWDEQMRVSRAGFAREVSRILGKSAGLVGQVGRDGADVTRQEGRARG